MNRLFSAICISSLIVAQASRPLRAVETSAPKTVLVGAAKVDITPDYPVRLTGYGSRTKESEGVTQKIWARALVIGGRIGGDAKSSEPDDEAPVLLLTAENCGIQETMLDEVARRLAEKAGLKRERIVCCSTHTHSAPMVNGFAPFILGGTLPPEHQRHVDRYTQEVIDKLTQVALDALAARRPARLSWGAGTVGFAVNRRAMKDGIYKGFGEELNGPVDRRLPILVARDEQGKLLAVVANYACHCTTLDGNFNQICGDWAGYADEYLEAEHPGAIALQTIGCGADANPAPRGTLELCRKHGRELADEVNRILATDQEPIREPSAEKGTVPFSSPGIGKGDSPRRFSDRLLKPLNSQTIRCRLNHIDLPFDTLPTRDQLAADAKKTGPVAARAKFLLDKLDRGEKLSNSIRYPVATWTWGDELAMVFLGGEVVVDYAARLRNLADENRLWINAYANDVPCYIASKRVLREGGYEADQSMVYYGRPARLAPQDEDLIVDAVQQLLPHEFLTAEMQRDFPPPKSPTEGLASIHVRAGLKVELVASEPLIVDPVAFDWGPDGRLWVVEMRDYPNGMDGKGKPGGRIKVLEDTHGDGHYDKATVFLDDIPYPTGIKVWRKGILVCAAPLIFYAEDTTGSGHADKRVTLYEGFGTGNQQHRVNGLRWSFDNWLLAGNGNSGGTIKSSLTGKVVNVNGRDLRIRPDTGEFEAQSGQTQYGICRDDWGSRFGGDNSQPIWHYVLDDHYLRRNSFFAPPSARKPVPVEPGAARVYPLSRTLERFNDYETANHFTSACSPELYRDQWLGDEYYNNSFVCEPVHNLIHREIVSPDGVTFTSHRSVDEKQKEFLASTDNWFRPVMIRTGPDGALWVADMYRFVIEHPEWIPQDWQRRLDVRAGDDKGRIYRIVRADAASPRVPRLDRLDTGGLVAALESGNCWVRDMAQQMLLWRNDSSAVPLLVKLAGESQSPLARLHALGTLAGLNVLTADLVAQGLRDPHPGVRRFAIQLREQLTHVTPAVNEAFWALAGDKDSLVQMQFAYALGSDLDRPTGPVIGAQLVAHADDPYLSAALFSSLRKDNIRDALAAVVSAAEGAAQRALVERLLTMAVAMKQHDAVRDVFQQLVAADAATNSPMHFSAIHSVLRMAARAGLPLDNLADGKTRRGLEQLHTEARRIIASSDPRDKPWKPVAPLLLAQGFGDDEADLTLLTTVMQPGQPTDLQAAVVDSLATSREPRVAAVLLSGWTGYAPSLRRQVFEAILSRDEWVSQMLDQVERHAINAIDFDARSRAELAALKNQDLRRRAETLLAVAPSADRRKVLEAYHPVMHMRGDGSRGKEVFTKHCAQCHFFEGIGHRVGPELASVKDRSPSALMVAILDPNQAVESRYVEYAVELTDGRVFSGIVADETSTSLTLIGPEEKRQSILRSDIESLRSTGRSLMPEGLEKDLTQQDLADIIAFVGKSEPPHQFPGNSPAIVHAASDGTISLSAAKARIYGPRLLFEIKHQNLGWWLTPNDRGDWTLESPAAGKYHVRLDYACADSDAGNVFLLRIAGRELRGKVAGTGTWDDYQQIDIGEIDLPAGSCEARMEVAAHTHGALFDLRTIVLVPAKQSP